MPLFKLYCWQCAESNDTRRTQDTYWMGSTGSFECLFSVERASYRGVDLWLCFLRFVFDLTRRQSWQFGFKRWYERKSTQLSGEKHVNDVCPLPSVLTRDFGSYSTHCSSPKMPWWHCGEARSRLHWGVQHTMCCTVMGWVSAHVGSVREWCLARDNFPTTPAIYHPTHPSLLLLQAWLQILYILGTVFPTKRLWQLCSKKTR